ncbi:serine/threonine-protein phosphatase 6 regulatory ankyrin repeat subunit C-like [Argonauta hians]
MEDINVDNFMDMYSSLSYSSDPGTSAKSWPPLCRACIDMDLDRITALIQSNADVNVTASHDGKTPLHFVCESQADGYDNDNACVEEISRMLISKGANINLSDNEGNTPISLSCENNNIQLVKLLLESGCNINTSSTLLNTPMKVISRNIYSWFSCHAHSILSGGELASIYSSPPLHIAKLLLDADKRLSEEATFLSSAVKFCNYKIVNDLLKSGMSPNILDEGGGTALGCACMFESVGPKVVELLLKYGANVNRGSSWKKQKPLIFAFSHNSVEKIKILLSYGAWITAEEMTELVSLNITKYILENPETADIDNDGFLSWRLLLAAGFTPTLEGTIGITDSLLVKLEKVDKCKSEALPWLTTLLLPERTLKEWCRIFIRRHLKVSKDDNIHKLHIPQTLQDFLAFKEFQRNKL